MYNLTKSPKLISFLTLTHLSKRKSEKGSCKGTKQLIRNSKRYREGENYIVFEKTLCTLKIPEKSQKQARGSSDLSTDIKRSIATRDLAASPPPGRSSKTTFHN